MARTACPPVGFREIPEPYVTEIAPRALASSYVRTCDGLLPPVSPQSQHLPQPSHQHRCSPAEPPQRRRRNPSARPDNPTGGQERVPGVR
ncbi:hypothetical protein GCM10011583_06740 [Streptomyces camponoticapitis]|uniref:Uncharacterized protein n=1 Tax=Streptomyces camponoticapitis TaxID=1616125 RepID=A0ABQ2DXX9_9ACTN|nr:hypothetical protein GCM10011583_06740 [Streptomyces camponoticapitis]